MWAVYLCDSKAHLMASVTTSQHHSSIFSPAKGDGVENEVFQMFGVYDVWCL
jgi:hypothetical protein